MPIPNEHDTASVTKAGGRGVVVEVLMLLSDGVGHNGQFLLISGPPDYYKVDDGVKLRAHE